MRKSLTTLGICLPVVWLMACHHRSNSTIVVNSPGKHVYIKYHGDVTFSKDSTTVESLSPSGYLLYEKNDKSFVVSGDSQGKCSLTFYHQNDTAVQDEDGKKFIAEGVKEMMELGVRSSYHRH